MHNRKVNRGHPADRKGAFDSITRPPVVPASTGNALKQTGVRKQERERNFGSDKENAGQPAKAAPEKPLPGYTRATKSSKSKAGPSEEWTFTMEDQLNSLHGDFAALKRDSVRLSLAGTENSLPGIAAQSPAPSSIAARLSALKRESFQVADNPLSSAGDTPLRELSAPKTGMPATYSALMPTTRENLRLTGAPEQRMSMSEMDPFEAAGHWDAPSLAQVNFISRVPEKSSSHGSPPDGQSCDQLRWLELKMSAHGRDRWRKSCSATPHLRRCASAASPCSSSAPKMAPLLRRASQSLQVNALFLCCLLIIPLLNQPLAYKQPDI